MANNEVLLLHGFRRHIAHILCALCVACLVSCASSGSGDDGLDGIDFRAEMRAFVERIAEYARATDADFLIVPQNGQELFTDSGEASGAPMTDYLSVIDGSGRESMFYGYYRDDELTPAEDRDHLVGLCALGETHGVQTLAIDYCSTHSKMDDSYASNMSHHFISFAADDRILSEIPAYPASPRDEHDGTVTNLTEAKNFLFLINGEKFSDNEAFVAAVDATNYDIIIMDLYQNEVAFMRDQIAELRTKPSGARRLVLCYLSVGEAETYRYYWKSAWKPGSPSWLEPENPDWEGNYKVRYWDPDWQSIIVGNDSSYLRKILDAGFDGAYLDIIDGFEYFEER